MFRLIGCDHLKSVRTTIPMDLILVKDNKAIDVEASVVSVRNSLKARTPEEVDAILRAVHMRANGIRKSDDKNERFRMYWIALETIINLDGKKTNIADRIETALIKHYENNNPGKKYKIKNGYEIKAIKDDRIGQFHHAIEKPDRINQLKSILDDLIRSEVGLSHKGFARQYLEEIR